MERNFASRTLFHADACPSCGGVNSETVDLIATDPPFNKGRDFRVAPDSIAQDARRMMLRRLRSEALETPEGVFYHREQPTLLS